MSGMDVDERNLAVSERASKSDTVFAVSEEMVVSFHANLPVEVRQILKSAGK
jgi:nuclear pore complex protein Nup133